MKTIKEILEEEGKIKEVRNVLLVMINASLKAIEEVAQKDSENPLYKRVESYMQIMRVAKDYLTEEQVRKISERFGQLARSWEKPYQQVAGAGR